MGTKVYVRERGEGREREGKRERREREERRDGGGEGGRERENNLWVAFFSDATHSD